MERREFVSSIATLGAGTVLTDAGRSSDTRQSRKTAPGIDDPVTDPALEAAELRREKTGQVTTFSLERKSKTILVPRGARLDVGAVKGQGYISQLWVTFPGWFWRHWDTTAAINQSILKTLILRIYWDGASKPAVEAPAGDFFGAGLCEVASFASRRFGTSSGGFFCKWPMPFRTGFRIEVENRDADVDTEIFCNALYQLTDSMPSSLGWFHAQFNTGRNDGPSPVKIAEATSRGHYAGCVVYLQGQDRNYLSFLEAPEYVYVDDEWENPRIVGTGLEDYFLGGWYFREGPFIGPYHGVPVKDALNASVAMYRIHESDVIRFERRMRFAFVNPWAPERLKPFAHSSVAFLYLDTPAGQGADLPAARDLLCWYRIRNTDHQAIP